MTRAAGTPSQPCLDAAAVVARHLQSEDEVTRCLAAKALGNIGENTGGDVAADALVAALMDTDPDVRADAMDALVTCARPQDATHIRRSLIGDPVQEVKVAALRVLAHLGDQESIALIRRLAVDRAQDTVSWEDAEGMWDDWLIVQIAAIEALGDLGASEAIEDLLAARCDEFGQELDHVVFSALSQIGNRGVAVLTGLLEDGDDRVRARALTALARTRPEILAPLIERFVADANAEVRSLAVACAAPQSEHAERLALHDPDAAVRLRAVSAFGGRRPDIATAALADADEAVRAAALEHVVSRPDLPAGDDLLANVIAWTRTAGAKLAGTSATALPRLAGERAAPPLIALAIDHARPVEARAAALGGLGQVVGEGALEQLHASATDPLRPVRVAALAGLARICGAAAAAADRSLAGETLAAAMAGELHGAGTPTIDEAVDAEGEGLAAPKVEGEGERRVTITRDGEIVEQAAAPEPEPLPRSETDVIEGRFPQSTLEAIQAPPNAGSGTAGVTLSDSDLSFLELAQGGRRRGRVSVDGPSEIGDDLRITALRIGACCGGGSIEQAIASALTARAQSVRVAAFEALARRAEAGPVSPGLVDLASGAVSDPDALVRGYCARMLRAASPDAATLLNRQIEDPDATVRVEALKAVGTRASQPRLTGLTDPSSIVRATALQLVLEHGDTSELTQALTICIERGFPDVLGNAWAASLVARELIVRSLADGSGTTRQIRVALESITDAARI
jgi:HEAT repeat protein